MNIAIIVEGETEKAFKQPLTDFLKTRLADKMPRLDPFPCDGRVYTGDKLKRTVEDLLQSGRYRADHVIALTDVYTGTRDFTDAQDAKTKMRQWVGQNGRFYPHVAQHDFEAWLLPYWDEIQKLAGHNRTVPGSNPESVNHNKPPSYHLEEIYRIGIYKKKYNKVIDGGRILRNKDLLVSASACPELKSFLNTIIGLCGGKLID